MTYSDRQLVSGGYGVDCELGHAVLCSGALHRTWFNHNGYASRRTVVRVQNLNLQAGPHKCDVIARVKICSRRSSGVTDALPPHQRTCQV